MRDHDFNDENNSYSCGKAITYNFCNGYYDEECGEQRGESGAGYTRNPYMGHSDDLTTLEIFPGYNPDVNPAITVFRD